jgi:hypothetical protein
MSAKYRTLFQELFLEFREATLLLALIPAASIPAYSLFSYTGNWIYLYIVGVLIFALTAWPLWVAVSLFLLWKNPRKYKEYEMKKKRRARKANESGINEEPSE